MAESSGKTGRGIKFEIGDEDSPINFEAVANVTSITPSGKNAEEIDFTHLDSTGGFRELRQGFKDPGSVGLELHFDPTNATHLDLAAKFLSGDLFWWRINYTGAGWAKGEIGRGFVQNPGDVSITVDAPVGGTATIRVTGPTEFVDI